MNVLILVDVAIQCCCAEMAASWHCWIELLLTATSGDEANGAYWA